MSNRIEWALHCKRLENRVKVLERRNAELRADLERQRLCEEAPWTPFQECDLGVFGNGQMVEAITKQRTFLNSRYQVTMFVPENHPILHLSIKRVDGAAIHDWRDLQRIKNELAGPEWEGVELYPAESRLVDGANQYHIWCIEDQFPLGFNERLLCEDSENGVTQRPWPEGQRPSDIKYISASDMAKAAGLE